MKPSLPASATSGILCLAAGAFGNRLSPPDRAAVQGSVALVPDAGLDFQNPEMTITKR